MSYILFEDQYTIRLYAYKGAFLKINVFRVHIFSAALQNLKKKKKCKVHFCAESYLNSIERDAMLYYG